MKTLLWVYWFKEMLLSGRSAGNGTKTKCSGLRSRLTLLSRDELKINILKHQSDVVK